MIKRIYPSPDECKVNNLVKCTERECHMVFKSDSNLNLHLAKTHGRPELLQKNGVKHYYCPETQCNYHKDKFFKNLKYLRQHYLKVHSKKPYNCINCQSSFVSDKALHRHTSFCGVKFVCCDCKAAYSSYETLQTHGRRKQHNIRTKLEYTLKTTPSTVIVKKHERLLLPKPVNVIIVSNCNPNKTQDQYCQTFINNIQRENNKDHVRKICQQSQTSAESFYFSAETQTDEIMSSKPDFVLSRNQKSSNTQTDFAEHDKLLCKISHNSLFKLSDHDMHNVITNSLSTQTCSDLNLYDVTDKMSTSGSTHSTTLIDTSINNFEFDNCHMETQTDFIFEDVMLSTDYLMSNMCTQTCDDVFTQFNFNDIQTQTVFDDDMFRSVESQTFMPLKMPNYGCKDMSHTETQTDTEFRQMLDVINS